MEIGDCDGTKGNQFSAIYILCVKWDSALGSREGVESSSPPPPPPSLAIAITIAIRSNNCLSSGKIEMLWMWETLASQWNKPWDLCCWLNMQLIFIPFQSRFSLRISSCPFSHLPYNWQFLRYTGKLTEECCKMKMNAFSHNRRKGRQNDGRKIINKFN